MMQYPFQVAGYLSSWTNNNRTFLPFPPPINDRDIFLFNLISFNAQQADNSEAQCNVNTE